MPWIVIIVDTQVIQPIKCWFVLFILFGAMQTLRQLKILVRLYFHISVETLKRFDT